LEAGKGKQDRCSLDKEGSRMQAETSLLVGRVSSRLVASLCVAFLDLPFAKFRFLAASLIYLVYI